MTTKKKTSRTAKKKTGRTTKQKASSTTKKRIGKTAGKNPPLAQSAMADARSSDPADILHHLLKLNNRLMAPFSIHLEHQYKISLNEFRLLMMIGRLGVTASHEVAEMTGVNAMSVSRAVASLKRHSRIQVTTDPKNRRRKALTLTPEGARLYRAMLPATNKVARYLFEALQPDEIAAFDRYVATLTEALEAHDEEGRSLFLERTRPDPDGK